MPADLLTGPVIITRYKGPTDHRPSRIIATHKRDQDVTIRAVIKWNHALSSEANHEAAAMACLARCQFSQPLTLTARGHDSDAYYWVTVGSWQLEAVAEMIRATGRTIAGPADADGAA